jgi:hypothetical protein
MKRNKEKVHQGEPKTSTETRTLDPFWSIGHASQCQPAMEASESQCNYGGKMHTSQCQHKHTAIWKSNLLVALPKTTFVDIKQYKLGPITWTSLSYKACYLCKISAGSTFTGGFWEEFWCNFLPSLAQSFASKIPEVEVRRTSPVYRFPHAETAAVQS